MSPTDNVLELIQLLYASPGEAAAWQLFIGRLRESLSGSVANIISHDRRGHHGTFVVTAGSDAEGYAQYQQHWSASDPWAYSPRYQHVAASQTAWVGDELIDHGTLKRTAFYADFGRHWDVVRVVGGRLESDGGLESIVSVNRGEHQEAFDQRDVALLATLIPHIRSALQIHRRLVTAETSSADLAAMLDLSSRAAVLLDSRCRVIVANVAAKELLGARDGLRVDRGELSAFSVPDTDRLRQLVGEAIKTATARGLNTGGMCHVTRPSGRRPFAVLIRPLTRPVPSAFVQSASVVAFITDPEQVALPDTDTLRTLFGLTPAEARLARLLVAGCSLEDASRETGLSLETLRTRVKTIFQKTDTHRQSDLIRLMLALPGCG